MFCMWPFLFGAKLLQSEHQLIWFFALEHFPFSICSIGGISACIVECFGQAEH
jgi:hypothetical protein